MDRTSFAGAIAPTSEAAGPKRAGRIVRHQLTAGELATHHSFSIALKLRDFPALSSRIAKGEVLRLEELQERHLPTRAQWLEVARWAQEQGLAVAPEDNTHLTVFAGGTVAQTQSALQVRFGRVTGTDGADYTSAISVPSLPADVARAVAGLLHLQPHVKPLHQAAITPVEIGPYVSPKTIAQLYNASALGLSGRGETIVVRGDAAVSKADLTAFWANTGLPTTLDQYTEINPPPQASSVSSEFTMDIEWASAMAPGAQIVYFGNVSVDQLFSWITSRPAGAAPIRQTTLSADLPESCYADGMGAPAETEYYAAMAALGISNFVATGDHGSNAATVGNTWPGQNGYTNGSTLTVDYPASDPFVIATGGTTVQFNPAGSVVEGAWALPTNLSGDAWSGYGASTGGLSRFFARPGWQAGAVFPVGGKRCVPDVAAIALSNRALYYFLDGAPAGASGTSLSSPVWAGLAAVIHEGLAKVGVAPGFLAPRLYALMGTDAFNQMLVGANSGEAMSSAATNGVYKLGEDYNLVTGLGSPNVGKIIAALSSGGVAAPLITSSPVAATATSGDVARFSVAATGGDPLFYQWLIDGIAIDDGPQINASIVAGSHTANLAISNVQVTQDADNPNRVGNGRRGISVVVTNKAGTAVSGIVPLHVRAIPNAPIVTALPQTKWAGFGVLGQDMELTIAVPSGSGLSYQWYHNGVAIPAATGSTCVVKATTYADAGIYLVTAANTYGATSSPLLALQINDGDNVAPVITRPVESAIFYAGQPVRLSVVAIAPGAITYSWAHDGITVPGANSPTYSIPSASAADAGRYRVYVMNKNLSGSYSEAALTFNDAMTWPSITTQPMSQTAEAGSTAVLSVAVNGTPAPAVKWQRNGTDVAGGGGPSLVFGAIQPGEAGIYTAVASSAAGAAASRPVITGIVTDRKVIGSGQELLPADVRHPNGNLFDQVLVTGAAESITADRGQITRTSFIDLNDDIVQVEFSGAGTLSLILEDASAPAPPSKYDQSVNYAKGHAGIVIVGADETTNVSVFTVGRATAFDPTGAYNFLLPPSAANMPANNGSSLFKGHAETPYDAVADIAFIAVSSPAGKFGGIRTSNAHYFATKGLTGIFAPGVAFQGPVFVGDIQAFDAATPVIQLGSTSDARITGGDLAQDNGKAVQVSGLTALKFTGGSDSQGRSFPAQVNRAVLEQDGKDVTSSIVVNPAP